MHFTYRRNSIDAISVALIASYFHMSIDYFFTLYNIQGLDFSSAISLRFYSPSRRQSLNVHQFKGESLHEQPLYSGVSLRTSLNRGFYFTIAHPLSFFYFRNHRAYSFELRCGDKGFRLYLQLTQSSHILLYTRGI